MHDTSAPARANRSRPFARRIVASIAALALALGIGLAGAGAAYAGDPTNPLMAADLHASTKQGQPVSVTLQGAGPAGDDIHYWITAQPGHGTVTQPFVSPTISYTPAAGFSGTDTFTYRVSDATWDSPIATVTVDVSPASPDNHAPVAQPVTVSVHSGSQTAVQFAGTDADGDHLTYAVATAPSHGTVQGTGDNVTYTPEGDYTGPDSFTYVASDGVAQSDPATVTITVEPQRPNHVPISVPPIVTTAQDTAVHIHLDATDADGDDTWFNVYNDQAHGTLTTPDGQPGYDGSDLIYTPALGFHGTDSFHYDVSDGRSTSDEYVVNITVTASAVVPHVPVARSFDVNAKQGSATPITLQGSDPDGDALTYTVVAAPSHGSLSGSGADLVYTVPPTVFAQTDSLTYTVSDGVHTSSPAQVLITLFPAQQSTTPIPDAVVSSDHVSKAGKLASPAMDAGGLVLAFVSADGPESAKQKVRSISGGGLDWTLVQRSNGKRGTAEVWQAFQAFEPANGLVVTAKLAQAGYDGSITVVDFQNASRVQNSVAAAGASTNPQVALTPRRAGAMVWAVGHDGSRATTPTPLTGQTLAHTFADAEVGDTFWTQSTGGDLPDAPLTVGAHLPKRDRWQLVAVEVSVL